MLVIRFARTGRKNKAQFRIVVQEHTATPTGKNTEIVGNWNPHQKEGSFKADRIKYWLSQGAQISDSVHNLLVSQKIIDDKKRAIKFSKKKTDDSAEEEGNKDGEVVADKKEESDKDNKDNKDNTEEKTEQKKVEKKTEEK